MPSARCGQITEIETVIVDGGFRNLVFVLVRTDEGIEGVGEATLEWHEAPVQTAVQHLAERVLGEDAGRIEYLWQLMYRAAYWRGGAVHMTALSGIDQALWDIKGKAANMPVYDLLGGRCRDVLPLYANGPRGETPDEYAASAAALAEQGYSALKVCPVGPTLAVDGPPGVRCASEIVAAIRAAIGPDVALAVDLHGRTSPAMAIRFARALEIHDIWFIEEPTLPDNVEALLRVAASTPIPLASGERWLTRAGFQRALQLGVLGLVQPDVAHCGGVSEIRRIAALAEFDQVGFAPHNPLGPVGTIVTAHVALATPNFVTLELAEGDHEPWRDQLVCGGLSVASGVLSISDAPGYGIELDRDLCALHPGIPRPLPGLAHDDGAFAEW